MCTRAEVVLEGQRRLQKLEFATEEVCWLHPCAAVEEVARQQVSEAEEGAMREIIEVHQLALDKAREEAAWKQKALEVPVHTPSCSRPQNPVCLTHVHAPKAAASTQLVNSLPTPVPSNARPQRESHHSPTSPSGRSGLFEVPSAPIHPSARPAIKLVPPASIAAKSPTGQNLLGSRSAGLPLSNRVKTLAPVALPLSSGAWSACMSAKPGVDAMVSAPVSGRGGTPKPAVTRAFAADSSTGKGSSLPKISVDQSSVRVLADVNVSTTNAWGQSARSTDEVGLVGVPAEADDETGESFCFGVQGCSAHTPTGDGAVGSAVGGKEFLKIAKLGEEQKGFGVPGLGHDGGHSFCRDGGMIQGFARMRPAADFSLEDAALWPMDRGVQLGWETDGDQQVQSPPLAPSVEVVPVTPSNELKMLLGIGALGPMLRSPGNAEDIAAPASEPAKRLSVWGKPDGTQDVSLDPAIAQIKKRSPPRPPGRLERHVSTQQPKPAGSRSSVPPHQHQHQHNHHKQQQQHTQTHEMEHLRIEEAERLHFEQQRQAHEEAQRQHKAWEDAQPTDDLQHQNLQAYCNHRQQQQQNEQNAQHQRMTQQHQEMKQQLLQQLQNPTASSGHRASRGSGDNVLIHVPSYLEGVEPGGTRWPGGAEEGFGGDDATMSKGLLEMPRGAVVDRGRGFAPPMEGDGGTWMLPLGGREGQPGPGMYRLGGSPMLPPPGFPGQRMIGGVGAGTPISIWMTGGLAQESVRSMDGQDGGSPGMRYEGVTGSTALGGGWGADGQPGRWGAKSGGTGPPSSGFDFGKVFGKVAGQPVIPVGSNILSLADIEDGHFGH